MSFLKSLNNYKAYSVSKAFKGQDEIVKKIISYVYEISNNKNVNVYLVGGPVRDILLMKNLKDLDFAVEHEDVVSITQELAQKLNAKYQHFKEFNTTKITLDNFSIDFSMTRNEYYASPGKLPKVKFDNIIADLKRRDFTINSIAISLSKKYPFGLLDPTGGLADLKRKIIRIIHDKSFIDDPTRILRAIRFQKRFKFIIEKKTESLLKQALADSYLLMVSKQRLLDEFLLALKEKKSYECISVFQKMGILRYIDERLCFLPKYKNLFGVGKGKIRVVLGLLPFFIDRPLSEVNAVMKKICMYGEIRNDVMACLNYIRFGTEISDKLATVLKKYLNIPKPLINGDVLLKLGFAPGPVFSQILTEIRNQQLLNKIKTKKQAISFIKNYFKK